MTIRYVDASLPAGGFAPQLAEAGVKAVGRYYNYGAGKKVLTRIEAKSLTEHGIAIWVVFEYYNNAPKWFSASLGHQDAVRALQCAKEIVGQPEGSTIYFSADYDETGKNYEARIRPYFEAINKTFSNAAGKLAYRIGVYSNGLVCRRLLEDDLVTETWLSCSTGHAEHAEFLASNKWSLAQQCKVPPIAGLDVDYNQASHDDFGQSTALASLTQSPAVIASALLHSNFISSANAAEKLEAATQPS